MEKKVNINSVLGGKAIGATLYALLFTVYTIVYTLTDNFILIRISYGLFYAVSFWYFIKILIDKNNSKFIRILNFLFIIIILYGIVSLLNTQSWQGHINKFTFLRVHFVSIIPIYAFYYFGKNGRIKKEWFALLFFVFVADAYLLYYHNRVLMMENILNADEGFTNNIGYEWASLLPLIAFFDKKKIIQYVSIVFIMFFVLTCFKRGAIIISVAGLLYYLLMSMRKTGVLQKLLIVIMTIGVVVFLYNYFESLITSNAFFSHRMEMTIEGDSSGRDDIYSYFFGFLFSGKNGINILFGNGAFATIKLLGIEAHNDWLEYAIDLGLFGVILYLIYWTRVLKNYFSYSKDNSNNPILLAMGMVIIMNLLRSFFSMSLDDMSFFSSAVLGYTMAEADNARMKTNLS